MATVNIYDMADTWNDGGAGTTTFTAIKMDVTDTSSASGSLLMDLQVGSNSYFKVAKNGTTTWRMNSVGSSSAVLVEGNTPNFRLTQSTGRNLGVYPFYLSGADAGNANPAYITKVNGSEAHWQLGLEDAAGPAAQTLSVQSVVAGTSNTAGQDFTIQGSAGTGLGDGGSIIFQVAPAGTSGTGQNTLEQFAEITSGRALNLYNTFTDATNFERGFLKWDSNTFTIGTGKGASGGTDRDITIKAGASGASIYIGTSGTMQMTGSTAWADSNAIFWLNRSYITSPSNGVLKISNRNQTDFDRLQFGGTTSSFPALKRSTTSLQARLADDTGFTEIQGKLTTDTAYTAGAPTPAGYLVVYDSTGTAYKIPAEAV